MKQVSSSSVTVQTSSKSISMDTQQRKAAARQFLRAGYLQRSQSALSFLKAPKTRRRLASSVK